jgi:hypothetical protein
MNQSNQSSRISRIFTEEPSRSLDNITNEGGKEEKGADCGPTVMDTVYL